MHSHGMTTRDKLVRSFKKQICKVMGQTSSSLFTHQVLPIAWDVALAQDHDPVLFCQDVGFSASLMTQYGFTHERLVPTINGQPIEPLSGGAADGNQRHF